MTFYQWMSLAGWVSSTIAFGIALGVIIGILIMLVRIVTPTASNRFYKSQQQKENNAEENGSSGSPGP